MLLLAADLLQVTLHRLRLFAQVSQSGAFALDDFRRGLFYEAFVTQLVLQPVSYTHLTLPTN